MNIIIGHFVFDFCYLQDNVGEQMPEAVTEVPFSLEDLDRTIAAFETVEQLFRSLSPDTWRQDLDSIYTKTHIHYRSRAYHLASRQNKGKIYFTSPKFISHTLNCPTNKHK